MITFVLDASVAVKWCLPAATEPFHQQAEDLLSAYRRSQVRFLVPDLFWPEVANALWKAVRRQLINVLRAENAYARVTDLGIPTIPSFDLVPKALQLAASHDRAVYDAVYVSLALQSRTTLITADERLANALAARFPVKWLGSF